MKRSTNLFYTVGSDTNFITFSNYGESLTGNFLSVNTKLFPSHFLCLYVPKLNADSSELNLIQLNDCIKKLWNLDPSLLNKYLSEDDKNKTIDEIISNFSEEYKKDIVSKEKDIIREEQRKDFIKYIAAYYENKLAFLRDKCIEHDYEVEAKLNPLYYLLETIEKWNGDNYTIEHIGDITEQNYNGTYTDIICVINASEHYPGEVEASDETIELAQEKYDSSEKYLYGWSVTNINDNSEDYKGPTNYKDVKPILDGNDFYNLDTKISKIIKTKISKDIDLKFNIIIPLYNVTNIDSASNTSVLSESDYLEATYTKNVPLGIWFSGKEPITLSRADAEYDPSWSLLLSSQFKPFPYSDKSPTEIDSSDKTLAFNTFAEVATRQNKIIDKFNVLSEENIKLKQEHQDILSRLKSIGTIDNIDDLCKQITDLKTDLYAKINSLGTQINGLENQIAELKANNANLQKQINEIK